MNHYKHRMNERVVLSGRKRKRKERRRCYVHFRENRTRSNMKENGSKTGNQKRCNIGVKIHSSNRQKNDDKKEFDTISRHESNIKIHENANLLQNCIVDGYVTITYRHTCVGETKDRNSNANSIRIFPIKSLDLIWTCIPTSMKTNSMLCSGMSKKRSSITGLIKCNRSTTVTLNIDSNNNSLRPNKTVRSDLCYRDIRKKSKKEDSSSLQSSHTESQEPKDNTVSSSSSTPPNQGKPQQNIHAPSRENKSDHKGELHERKNLQRERQQGRNKKRPKTSLSIQSVVDKYIKARRIPGRDNVLRKSLLHILQTSVSMQQQQNHTRGSNIDTSLVDKPTEDSDEVPSNNNRTSSENGDLPKADNGHRAKNYHFTRIRGLKSGKGRSSSKSSIGKTNDILSKAIVNPSPGDNETVIDKTDFINWLIENEGIDVVLSIPKEQNGKAVKSPSDGQDTSSWPQSCSTCTAISKAEEVRLSFPQVTNNKSNSFLGDSISSTIMGSETGISQNEYRTADTAQKSPGSHEASIAKSAHSSKQEPQCIVPNKAPALSMKANGIMLNVYKVPPHEPSPEGITETNASSQMERFYSLEKESSDGTERNHKAKTSQKGSRFRSKRSRDKRSFREQPLSVGVDPDKPGINPEKETQGRDLKMATTSLLDQHGQGQAVGPDHKNEEYHSPKSSVVSSTGDSKSTAQDKMRPILENIVLRDVSEQTCFLSSNKEVATQTGRLLKTSRNCSSPHSVSSTDSSSTSIIESLLREIENHLITKQIRKHTCPKYFESSRMEHTSDKGVQASSEPEPKSESVVSIKGRIIACSESVSPGRARSAQAKEDLNGSKEPNIRGSSYVANEKDPSEKIATPEYHLSFAEFSSQQEKQSEIFVSPQLADSNFNGGEQPRDPQASSANSFGKAVDIDSPSIPNVQVRSTSDPCLLFCPIPKAPKTSSSRDDSRSSQAPSWSSSPLDKNVQQNDAERENGADSEDNSSTFSSKLPKSHSGIKKDNAFHVTYPEPYCYRAPKIKHKKVKMAPDTLGTPPVCSRRAEKNAKDTNDGIMTWLFRQAFEQRKLKQGVPELDADRKFQAELKKTHQAGINDNSEKEKLHEFLDSPLARMMSFLINNPVLQQKPPTRETSKTRFKRDNVNITGSNSPGFAMPPKHFLSKPLLASRDHNRTAEGLPMWEGLFDMLGASFSPTATPKQIYNMDRLKTTLEGLKARFHSVNGISSEIKNPSKQFTESVDVFKKMTNVKEFRNLFSPSKSQLDTEADAIQASKFSDGQEIETQPVIGEATRSTPEKPARQAPEKPARQAPEKPARAGKVRLARPAADKVTRALKEKIARSSIDKPAGFAKETLPQQSSREKPTQTSPDMLPGPRVGKSSLQIKEKVMIQPAQESPDEAFTTKHIFIQPEEIQLPISVWGEEDCVDYKIHCVPRRDLESRSRSSSVVTFHSCLSDDDT